MLHLIRHSMHFLSARRGAHSHLFFACVWTSTLWRKVKFWLRLTRNIASLTSAIRALNNNKKGLQLRMRRVGLALIVYLIWKKGTEECLMMLENLLISYFANSKSYSIQFCIFMTAITWLIMLQTERRCSVPFCWFHLWYYSKCPMVCYSWKPRVVLIASGGFLYNIFWPVWLLQWHVCCYLVGPLRCVLGLLVFVSRLRTVCLVVSLCYLNELSCFFFVRWLVLLLNFGPHVLKTVYTSFEQSVGV
jgi:hypothetical protein